ncbi:MAG TPA: hypothetical protein VE173_13090 [Longimicrobiales bacterium]|nr:hypothetical protein [Longimicrobiales bacterium]
MSARKGIGTRVARLSTVVLLVAGAGCERSAAPTVPSAEVVRSYYTIPGEFSVTMRGNVAELVVRQPETQLQRGGSIWARVGPYIYLFSQATRDLFNDRPALAGVRVVTRGTDGREIARATLSRNELNAVAWKRALHIAGLARRDGTRMPARLEDLIEWGEEHTDHRYNSELVHTS